MIHLRPGQFGSILMEKIEKTQFYNQLNGKWIRNWREKTPDNTEDSLLEILACKTYFSPISDEQNVKEPTTEQNMEGTSTCTYSVLPVSTLLILPLEACADPKIVTQNLISPPITDSVQWHCSKWHKWIDVIKLLHEVKDWV